MERAAAAAAHAESAPSRTATFRGVLAETQFRALLLAQLLSIGGDQLARVAMTVLVYDRTHSALWTAVTYAATLLPWLVGGLALAGLADRLPRRRVMVACDLARLVLVCAMVVVSREVPGAAALWLLIALLFTVTLLDSPFKAARSALLPDILAGDRYVLGTAVTQLINQIGIVAGFALGGLVVALVGVGPALLVDAATFAASALLVRLCVWARPAPARGRHGASQRAQLAGGVRLVFGDRRLRTLMLLGWLMMFYLVPMGLAAPYADQVRGSLPIGVATGLIFAAAPFGTAVGSVAFGRLVPPERRQNWMGPLAVIACGVLVLAALQPGLPAVLAILAVSGLAASYQLAANAAFVAAIPAQRRAQAFGLANGGIQVGQGLGVIAAGALAAHTLSPGSVVALSGGVGLLAAAALALTWRRQLP
ncbi:MAG: MFS transporter [Streptosporangiaceae bacterium]